MVNNAHNFDFFAGDGDTISYNLSFDNQRGGDLRVYVDDEEIFNFYFSDGVLRFESPPILDSTILVVREVGVTQQTIISKLLRISPKAMEYTYDRLVLMLHCFNDPPEMEPPAPDTYTITAISGDNGSISDEGIVVYNEGDDATYTITPDNSFDVEDVLVDGVSIGAVTNHTFADIQQDHVIEAQFFPELPDNYFRFTSDCGGLLRTDGIPFTTGLETEFGDLDAFTPFTENIVVTSLSGNQVPNGFTINGVANERPIRHRNFAIATATNGTQVTGRWQQGNRANLSLEAGSGFVLLSVGTQHMDHINMECGDSTPPILNCSAGIPSFNQGSIGVAVVNSQTNFDLLQGYFPIDLVSYNDMISYNLPAEASQYQLDYGTVLGYFREEPVAIGNITNVRTIITATNVGGGSGLGHNGNVWNWVLRVGLTVNGFVTEFIYVRPLQDGIIGQYTGITTARNDTATISTPI